jgi:hypothetical protein
MGATWSTANNPSDDRADDPWMDLPSAATHAGVSVIELAMAIDCGHLRRVPDAHRWGMPLVYRLDLERWAHRNQP